MDKSETKKNGRGGALCVWYGVNFNYYYCLQRKAKKRGKIKNKKDYNKNKLIRKKIQWLPAYLENSSRISSDVNKIRILRLTGPNIEDLG